MSNPATREQHIAFCLRQIGFDPNEINVSDEQIEDCVDMALQYFRDFHFDGTENWYVSHQITQTDKDNKYIEIPDDIIGITRVFPVGSTNASVNMFDLRYQLRLHDLYDFTSTSYVNYVLTMQHIRTLDLLFSGETPIRYNRHTNKLYIDMNWEMMQVGEYVVMEGFKVVDENIYTDVWNDRMLKRLSTAYIKRVYGTNMKKYRGLKLLGGIEFNGQQIYDEAVLEIAEIEELIRRTYEAPPRFIIATLVPFLLNTSMGYFLWELIRNGWFHLPLV